MKFSTRDGTEVTLDIVTRGLMEYSPESKGKWTSNDIMDLVLDKDYLVDGLDLVTKTYSGFNGIVEVINFLNNFGTIIEE